MRIGSRFKRWAQSTPWCSTKQAKLSARVWRRSSPPWQTTKGRFSLVHICSFMFFFSPHRLVFVFVLFHFLPLNPLTTHNTHTCHTGDLDTDLFNGGGSSSWPMSFPVIATVYKSSNVTDCGTIQNLLNFFSWAQTNPQVGVQANSLGYFALSIVYVKELIEQIDTILCNGQQALSTAYLIGSGAPVPVYTTSSNPFSIRLSALSVCCWFWSSFIFSIWWWWWWWFCNNIT